MPERILWLAWKDSKHPQTGGAEVVLHEVAKRQVAAGYQVTILTARYPGAVASETVDGIEIIRVGNNRYVHNVLALLYYLRRLHNKYDYVIETVNTSPYLASLFPGRATPAVLYHQLAREVWLHETGWPLNRLGFHVLEPLATRLLATGKQQVLGMSASTNADLARYGFRTKRMHVITEGIHLKPVRSWRQTAKFDQPTILSLGAIRGMKRTLEQIKAFERLKLQLPNAMLIVAGAPFGAYGEQVLTAIKRSVYAKDIDYRGPVSHTEKRQLMQRCHVIWVTSIKEGWGLIVSEANSQGTPAVVYDADGLRDSVKHDQTGLICQPNPQALADATARLLGNSREYDVIRGNAHAFSKQLTFDKTYADIMLAIQNA